jgi:thiosulfate/3-mercaptopyruvate sulfurtransferase
MQRTVIAALARLFLWLFLVASANAWAFSVPGPLVDTQWLAANLEQVVILDARKDPQSFIRKAGAGELAGVQACGAKASRGLVSGHIPGSALADWKHFAVRTQVGDVELYDMVPAKRDFEKLMQASGVNPDSAVVVSHAGADIVDVAAATRLYWTLKYYGHDNVALLDGGVAKWAAEKRDIEYGRSKPKAGTWVAGAERPELLATLEDVKQASASGGSQILDIRTPEYYLGLVHKADKVARKGHVPGAKNLPHLLLVKGGDKGATFYSVEDLQRVAGELKIDRSKPVITHCNTGHLASSGWFVLHELLGDQDTRLYVGSMNEWAADPARPVSTQSE